MERPGYPKHRKAQTGGTRPVVRAMTSRKRLNNLQTIRHGMTEFFNGNTVYFQFNYKLKIRNYGIIQT